MRKRKQCEPRVRQHLERTGDDDVRGAGVNVYPSQLKVTVSGDTATVTNFCPGTGTASLRATGNGNTVKWTGSEVCDPSEGWADCSQVF